MKNAVEKTNALRQLDQKKIPYTPRTFETDCAVSGTEVAKILGLDPARVYKTLVTVGKSRQNYVFVVPVEKELHLKKAAAAVGEKSIEMIPQKDLLPLTGYVHGGCSPIGMKKPFPTVLDASAEALPTIFFSGGRIGLQVEVAPGDLKKLVNYRFAEITE